MTGAGRRAATAIVIGILIAAAPVFGQDVDRPESRTTLTNRRPIEVAFGVDGVASWFGNGRDLRLSVGFPKGERLSFEFFAGSYHGTIEPRSPFNNLDYSGNIRGIYGFQIRQQVLSGLKPGLEPFITYGVMGVTGDFLKDPDICIGSPCTPTQPAHVIPPGLGLFGFGVQHPISTRLALRLEAQGAVPVGIRAAAALAIAVDGTGYRTRARP